MRILHLASHKGNNIGNAALALGAQRVLQEDCRQKLDFRCEPWDEYNWAGCSRYEDLVAKLNRDHDALMIGPASIYDGEARYKNSGFRFNLPEALWPEIRKPILFYGTGYGLFPRQPYYNKDRFRKTIEHILSRPDTLFSVRNDGSREWIESILGHASDRIHVIPDPAFYVPGADEGDYPQLEQGRRHIVLSLNTDGEVYRFGGYWPQRLWRFLPDWRLRKRRFLSQLASAMDKLCKEFDAQLVLCPHHYSDYKMMSEFLSYCSPQFATYRVVATGTVRGLEAGKYHYGLYKKADAVVSMRVHSMVCGVGLGTPTVGLTSAPRMSYFMKDVGMGDFDINVLDPEIGDKLHTLLKGVLMRPEETRTRLAKVYQAMRERTRKFNHRVYTLWGLSEDCLQPNEVNLVR